MLNSSKLCQRKALNMSQVRETVLLYSTWVLCYCQQMLILSLKNKATKKMRLGARGTGRVEIVFTLLTELVTLYMGATIV